jgi:hypothetical protein
LEEEASEVAFRILKTFVRVFKTVVTITYSYDKIMIIPFKGLPLSLPPWTSRI